MMSKKRSIAALLCVILILSSLMIGCKGEEKKVSEDQTGKNDTEQTNQQVDREDGQGVKLPLVDKPTTIRWATRENWYPEAPLSSGLPIWKEIEEKTNIKIEWETPADYDNAIKTRLAANADLPDIVGMPWPGDPTIYGESGVLIPLEKMIEEQGHNIQKVFEDYPNAKKLHTTGDGHIYGLAAVIRGSADLNTMCFFVRKDWLDELGLQEPDTLDDWYVMMSAFKQKGEMTNTDILPFAGDGFRFCGAFGLTLNCSDYGFGVDSNGKVVYQWILPEMKELLAWWSKMYKEGLIRGWPSRDQIVNNQVGSMYYYPDLIPKVIYDLRANGYTNAVYIPVKPPAGPDGKRSLERDADITTVFHGITATSPNKEAAFKLLDYMWSEEGIRYMAWGMENVSYVMEDGKPKYTEWALNNPDGLGVTEALRTLGAWPTIPWVQQSDTYAQLHSQIPELARIPEVVTPYHVDTFPKLLATKEEQDRLAELDALHHYRGDMILKFFTGQESLDKFDDFVKSLKDMNLDELLEIKQRQYDRTFKN